MRDEQPNVLPFPGGPVDMPEHMLNDPATRGLQQVFEQHARLAVDQEQEALQIRRLTLDAQDVYRSQVASLLCWLCLAGFGGVIAGAIFSYMKKRAGHVK